MSQVYEMKYCQQHANALNVYPHLNDSGVWTNQANILKQQVLAPRMEPAVLYLDESIHFVQTIHKFIFSRGVGLVVNN